MGGILMDEGLTLFLGKELAFLACLAVQVYLLPSYLSTRVWSLISLGGEATTIGAPLKWREVNRKNHGEKQRALFVELSLCSSFEAKGWAILVEKLCHLGVASSSKVRMPPVLVISRQDALERNTCEGHVGENGGASLALCGGNLERKPYLVKWATICSDKKKESLGVRHLALLNKTFPSKWIWRFAMENEAFWK
ncbi:hypothetical protein CK203_068462 [Vitis vinifera]|uniref:Uncharacterized protein n=1 Tax=Vitis vinifera TaxID=29760 RepID=A0A438F328_VITVI|nr:hypothetical protein CK203_068462 [Vitis vinifera]